MKTLIAIALILATAAPVWATDKPITAFGRVGGGAAMVVSVFGQPDRTERGSCAPVIYEQAGRPQDWQNWPCREYWFYDTPDGWTVVVEFKWGRVFGTEHIRRPQ